MTGRLLLLFFSIYALHAKPMIFLGIDNFFEEKLYEKFKGKKVGLIINQTSIDRDLKPILSLFRDQAPEIQVVAIFSPEHGFKGHCYAAEKISNQKEGNLPVYSLHGEVRRPKPEMLKGIDVLIYDIQCTGVRAYTYPTTLFYIMEEAAKAAIPVVILDRPNPINGITVDGPLLEEKWRSFIGYINVPYCHGMTIGELAQFFNAEYCVGCQLEVVPMKGWKRGMSYRDTGLVWIPPSPNVPEPDTPLFYPSTGLLGELQIANIGIGFTLPFKIVGAPWICAAKFAEKLNAQKLPGVYFQPFYFRPFWGLYRGVDCQGVLIQVTDPKIYRPVAVQYLLLGMLKSLYPKEFLQRLSPLRKKLFCKANGTEAVYEILLQEKYPAWKLIDFQRAEREAFLEKRKTYLLPYPD